MATRAQVSLNGRFPAGTVVRLVKVQDERALRPEGGELVDVKKVKDDGSVTFQTGVEAGGRYFISGYIEGSPVDVRVRGNAAADDTAGLQAPVSADRVRLSDGSWLDEAPAAADAVPGTVPGLHQVKGRVALRSATPRGSAHPVVEGEPAPYPSQESVDGDAQRSDTELGQASPVEHEAPASQSEVRKGTAQRSDTPMGYATPVASGDPVKAQLVAESAETKASVGEPVKAHANPAGETAVHRTVDGDPAVVVTDETREALAAIPAETVAAPGDDGDVVEPDGLDAEGQPVAGDVAFASGVEPADKPAEA